MSSPASVVETRAAVQDADAAVTLWLAGHKVAVKTGYLIYNSLMLPIEQSRRVLQYLIDRAATVRKETA
jgi:hypothetical protein